MLAALNHPHIAHIHGLEESGGVRALVLEFVNGPTLADRIAQGPIPLTEALTIARQIAEALEAAHDQGIIHRDLKPANIKVRTDGTVKVLDFGLAKALDPTSAGHLDLSASPTITAPAPMTEVGGILGTAAYMSPEQARGQALDKRTDIWAFGCVLFEMLVGRRAFPAATMSDTIAAVLERSPDWTALPPATPPVRHALARCLEKDRKHRWRDIGDVRLQLEDATAARPQTDASPTVSRAGERAAWALLVVMAAAVAAAVAPMFRTAPEPKEIRFNLLFPRGMTPDFPQLALSPDGEQIVASASFGLHGPSPLWLRPLSSTSGRLLTGTEGASFPFWSPDGRSIGFFAEQKLKRLDVDSQAIQILADAPVARGGTWLTDGTILFAPNAAGPLFRVAAIPGTPPAETTKLEPGQRDHRAPFLLPGGTHFLFYARGETEVRGVHVARVDGSGVKRLLDADGAAVYAPSGHLLFARQGELLAQPFDPLKLTLLGEPFRVADSVSINPGISLASLSASAAGPIAYGTDGIRRTQFAWFDRAGKRLETVGTPDQRSMANPSLSPDGNRLAFSRAVGGNWDVYVLDMQGAVSQVTSARSLDFNPVWSMDGRQIFYQSNNASISSRSVIEGTPEQVVLKERTMIYPSAVSPDGTVLLYTRASGLSTDLWYVSLAGDRTPRAFTQTTGSERDGQFSPDGKWVAYQSNEAGHSEIYLQPFPGPGNRIQVSVGGGEQVRWAPGGSELFYVASDQRLTAVRVRFGPNAEPVLGTPLPLFPTEFANSVMARQQFVVSPDGQRFLMNAATEAIDPASITVILNWRGRP
jgi:Tol biopolymer transport system component